MREIKSTYPSPTTEVKNKMTSGVLKIANRSTSTIYHIDNCTIEGEVVNEVKLQGRRVAWDISCPIMSLTELTKEG